MLSNTGLNILFLIISHEFQILSFRRALKMYSLLALAKIFFFIAVHTEHMLQKSDPFMMFFSDPLIDLSIILRYLQDLG